MEGLQQFDADLAVAGAAVEQEAVLGIEATLQEHPGEGRIVQLFDLVWRQRCGLLTGLLALQQLALVLTAFQLPETQPHQYRQHGQYQQGRQQPGLKPLMAGTLMRRYGWLYSTPNTPVVESLMLKAAIVLLLVATLVSLFSGLFFLVRDEGRTSRVITALFIRVTLSALTVALIGWGFYTGQLRPAFGF